MKKYPKQKPSVEGDYLTNKGLLHYDSEFDEWSNELENKTINISDVVVFKGIKWFMQLESFNIDWISNLSKKGMKYVVERVEFMSALSVAIPFGIIKKEAIAK